jgi:hypothetical protein
MENDRKENVKNRGVTNPIHRMLGGASIFDNFLSIFFHHTV